MFIIDATQSKSGIGVGIPTIGGSGDIPDFIKILTDATALSRGSILGRIRDIRIEF